MVLPVKYYVTPAFLHMRLPSQADNTADSTAGNTAGSTAGDTAGNTGPFEVARPRN